jgi:hypothetical protein
MTTKPKTRKAPVAKPDLARSRRYRTSRTRNVLIKAHATIGELGISLPPELIPIDREICRIWQTIKGLIDILDEAGK